MRLALLLALLAAPALAAPYDDARALYDAGRFEAAAEAFARLAKESPRDAALHYDLGNARLKAGKLGLASAAYQRAFALDPRDRDIRDNLDFALRRAGEELAPQGVPAAAFAAFTALSERELAGLHWLAAWAALLLAASALWSRRGLGTREAWAAGVWLVVGLWWAGLRSALPADRGVIAVARAELRNGPGERFSVGYTAPEGRRVRVLSESGRWLEVGLLKEGVRGWVAAESVERL